MEIYIDVIQQLQGYIRKHTQIADVHLWKDRGEGIRGVLIPELIGTGGPVITGKEFNFTLKLIAPFENWKELFQKIGVVENKLNSCFSDEEQKINLQTELGSWNRNEDDSNLIWENSLIVRVVRVVP